MPTIDRAVEQKQTHPHQLSCIERRLLLSANLQLFLHRLRHNMTVSSADIARLAALGDDQEGAA